MRDVASKVYRRGFVTLAAISGAFAFMRLRPRSQQTAASPLPPEAKSHSFRLLGPGGGGALFLPLAAEHYIFVTCDMGPAYLSQDAGETWRFVDLDGAVGQIEPFDKGLWALGFGLWESSGSLEEWRMIFPEDERARVTLAGDHAEPQFEGAPNPVALAQSAGGRLWIAAMENETAKLFVREAKSDAWVFNRTITFRPQTLHCLGETLFGVDEARGIVNINDNLVALPSRGTTRLVSSERCAFALTGTDGDALSGATELLRSTDLGKTWTTCTSALVQAIGPVPARFLAIATNSVGDLIASFKTSDQFGVMLSQDAGQSFRPLFVDGDKSRARNVFDPWLVHRFEPSWADAPLGLSTNASTCVATDYGRVLVSHDAGRSWHGTYSTRTLSSTLTTTGINATTAYGVHTDPFDHSRIILASADIGGFVSEDGASSWTPCEGVPRAWRNTMYWAEFDPHVRGRVLAAVSDTHDLPRPKMWRHKSPRSFRGGVVHSEDGGRTFRHRAKGLPDAAVTHLLVDPGSGRHGRWFACVLGHGIFRSTDGGETWASSSLGLPDEPMVWTLSRSTDGTLYAVIARRGEGDNAAPGAIFTSSRNGTTWRALALPHQVTGPTSVIADPFQPQRLIMSAWGWHHPERDTRGGIFVSDDRGGTWRRVLSRDNFVFSLTRDPLHPKRIFAAGFSGTAWRSDDSGETFLPIKNFRFKNAHRVFPDRNNDGYIYITTFGASLWHGFAEVDEDAKTLTEQMPRRRTV